FKLTEHQKTALEGLLASLENNDDSEPILLHGVAGSGKTEVYFQLMDKVIRSGKSVIFLVPEITLTSQISARIISRFGPDSVGIWHSSLSTGERLDIWKRIHSGEIRIVLGARSAVFAPVVDLGLIVMDEEHESAYKQDTPSPRYHARDIALERAKRFGAKVVLGSATPDVSTYYRAKNLNKIFSLPTRVEERPMAKVHTIDMREEIERGNKSIFSRGLSYAIQETIENKHQVMLLINRRGFTTYVFCRSCGYVAECKNCSIPLIYHSNTNELRCHYCNHKQETYTVCPECNSNYIKHYGTGTQRVEQEVQKKFPNARVLRLDSDITAKKNAHYEVIEAFSRGEADILIGTQMIAKGLDLHGVTLVGVLASDSVFTFPDYRSMERGFQLLTQVAGRAGRGNDPGKVIFQCYSSHLYPMVCAQKQDYHCFYSFEILEREKYNYPPFSQLIRIVLSSEYYNPTFSEAIKLANYLDESLDVLREKIEILGPSECIIPKIQGKFRMQILLKNIISDHGHKQVMSLLKNYNTGNVRMIVDVDPLNMM
ncbi:MAG: primosomal protein N', partial [Vampirovibrionia bacterium]